MANTRTTIVIDETLLLECKKHVFNNNLVQRNGKDDLSKLIRRALINQLEVEGNFQVRDKVEGENVYEY